MIRRLVSHDRNRFLWTFLNIIRQYIAKWRKKIEPFLAVLPHLVLRASNLPNKFCVWKTEIFFSKGKSDLKAGSLAPYKPAFNLLTRRRKSRSRDFSSRMWIFGFQNGGRHTEVCRPFSKFFSGGFRKILLS